MAERADSFFVGIKYVDIRGELADAAIDEEWEAVREPGATILIMEVGTREEGEALIKRMRAGTGDWIMRVCVEQFRDDAVRRLTGFFETTSDMFPDEISENLRDDGIDPGSLVELREVDPFELGLLKAWVTPENMARALNADLRDNEPMPALVFETSDGDLKIGNGVHRVDAAREQDRESIKVSVADQRAIDLVYEPHGPVAANRWAYDVTGAEWDPEVDI